MKRKVFILDDEPMFLDWIEDYLESHGYEVEFYTTINDAHQKLLSTDLNDYDAFLVDLNVPASAELEAVIKEKPEVFHDFRGLFIAQQARTLGVQGRKIIVYSVHDDAKVDEFCSRLNASYLQKGRAKVLKDKLSSLINVE
ncbi:hypothetical protein [Litoribacillus peritrichatus]|uniref:Response regulatory domain-containing protein n=1 Tax=Litoribacillus peritrichatus TaxID=718191 RepID=A0ABP7MF56_9GAMM